MIEVDLMPVLFDKAKRAGLGVGMDCEQEVRRFITRADPIYRSSPQDRDVIKQNFAGFVDVMIGEAENLGIDELRERTFHAARIKVCPLFPFC